MATAFKRIPRPGIITFDYLMQPGEEAEKELKRWLLLYDEFWVPNLTERLQSWKNFDMEGDVEMENCLANLDWLASRAQLVESPVNFETETNEEDEVIAELKNLNDQSWTDLEKTYETAEEAATGAVAAQFNIEIATSRLIAYVSWRDKEESVYPIVFPFENELSGFESISKRQKVLSIILDQLPEPSDNLPLQDIVDFKADEATKEKYSNLWNWIRKIAKEEQSAGELREEIDFLLHDYESNLKRFTKKTSLTRLQTVVNAVGDVPGNLISLKLGKILGVGLEMKSININANDEELKLPGSELAYIKEAANVLAKIG